MRIKITDDNEATWRECDLRDAFPDDDEEYEAAHAELTQTGRYWAGGGAAPLMLIMRVRESDPMAALKADVARWRVGEVD